MASKVGFVGLDEYSVDMAASLIRSGYKVQAFEISDPLVDKFFMLGGIRSASPMDAGKDVSALVVVISHVDQIDDIFFGHEGVLKGLQKGAVIILQSTILPSHMQKLEKTFTGNLTFYILERMFLISSSIDCFTYLFLVKNEFFIDKKVNISGQEIHWGYLKINYFIRVMTDGH
ncbi:hypothetical protein CICLE_v10009694mg [Citrus x clementina]|uniref:6-phosphogluconate dehydrogenase NADP-binding domain-containing protein n=2 Tax=Citrus TaxID=2706 RepID=A0A067DX34_CITSI|nr:hypothetical protein CICLE_v10009694mg [Citrus x clementina]KDO47403.1 hypothetical protein CISIN_1g044797mg [Citrus sinensis]